MDSSSCVAKRTRYREALASRNKKLKTVSRVRDSIVVDVDDDSEEDRTEEMDGNRSEEGAAENSSSKTNVIEIEDNENEEEEEERDWDGDEMKGIASRTRGKVGVRMKMRNGSDSVHVVSGESRSSRVTEDENSNDEDYGTDESQCSVTAEESNSYSGDEEEEQQETDDSDIVRRIRIRKLGKKRSNGVKLKRKEVSEPDLHVSINTDRFKISISQQGNFVAKSIEKNFGTPSHPICVGDEGLDSSSGLDDNDEEEEDEEEEKLRPKATGTGKTAKVKREEEEEEKLCRKATGTGKTAKVKRAGVLKGYDVFNVLLDSILDKGEVTVEELVPTDHDEDLEQEKDSLVVETLLPLKFSFGIDELKPEEKSNYEKEMDQMWDEFDFAIRCCEIGSSIQVDNEETGAPELGTDQATLCSQGKHQEILDEQIGVRCRFCSFVRMEIKYIIPPWKSGYCSGGPGKTTSSGEEDYSMLDTLQFQDRSGGSQDSYLDTKGTVWELIPGVRRSMFAHQQEGFEFMWKNLAGGIELENLNKCTSSNGVGGCVISHAPGTGKTRLTIVFLRSYLELYPKCRPILIAPKSMLLGWEEEFRKWKVDIPFHNLNKEELSGKENMAALNLLKKNRQDRSQTSIRMVKLYSWAKEDKSILGVSYTLFEKLAGERFLEDKGNKKNGKIRRILLETPCLLVLDEGHTPRNDQSLIWKVLLNIETERRIILSGTPFQNNFDELYNTLCLVRPKFADMISSSKSREECKRRSSKGNVARGNWASLTSSIGKPFDDRLEELRAMIDPFVHVHRGSILEEKLPGLIDCVVVLNPPSLQKKLLETIQGIQNSFELDFKVSLISVHPSLLTKFDLSREEESIVDKDSLTDLRHNPIEGVKTRFILEFVRLSEVKKEKVLVFSQYIDPLEFIKDQLNSCLNWTEGKEVLQMDGKLEAKQRQSLINTFNDPTSEAKVLLASTKACCEGISLVGASRVVLIDVVWNPSVERQAISRAYRLGQTKTVYTYRLITSGTEGRKYCRQVEKDRLSELLFCSGDKQNNSLKSSSSDDEILDKMKDNNKLKDMFRRIIYKPKDSDFNETFGSVSN